MKKYKDCEGNFVSCDQIKVKEYLVYYEIENYTLTKEINLCPRCKRILMNVIAFLGKYRIIKIEEIINLKEEIN